MNQFDITLSPLEYPSSLDRITKMVILAMATTEENRVQAFEAVMNQLLKGDNNHV